MPRLVVCIQREIVTTVDEKTLQNLEMRLSRIESQVRGVRDMTADERLPVDIVTQIPAVQAALNKVGDIVVSDHLKPWLSHTVDGSSNGGQDIESLLKVLQQHYR